MMALGLLVFPGMDNVKLRAREREDICFAALLVELGRTSHVAMICKTKGWLSVARHSGNHVCYLRQSIIGAELAV
jgi:hypothetical protein